MATYPLAKLIGLRAHRVDEAQRNRVLAEKKVEQAKKNVLQKQKEIDEYKIWKEQEAQRRYDEVMFKELSSDKFEKFKQDIANLNIGELKLIDEKHTLEQEVETLKIELEKSKEALKKASADLNKLEEHRKIWTEAQRIENERKEETELEDFHKKINFF